MFSVGNIVNNHKIVSSYRAGGYGCVHKVENITTLEKLALKQNLDGASPDSLSRFKSENEMLKKLVHENIIKSKSDTYENPTGYHYFMELADSNLQEFIYKTKQLGFSEKKELFLNICKAVCFSHRNNIVHRDIHVGNVLIKHEEDRPVPKISVFGVAKDFDGFDQSSFVLEMWGWYKVQPPEVFFMIHAEKDLKKYCLADIYALGIICHTLFIGEPNIYWANLFASIERFFLYRGLNIGDIKSIPIADRKILFNEWLIEHYFGFVETNLPIEFLDISEGDLVRKIVYGCLELKFEKRISSVDEIIALLEQ